jgi:diaminopimelate epimerase
MRTIDLNRGRQRDYPMRFTKMEGLGNDYIYVNALAEAMEECELPTLARKISDRHFGVGGDGLVLIMGSDRADFRMKMMNSDGSEAEMCGNAVRCVAKYVYEKGLTEKRELEIETLAGIIKPAILDNGLIRVDMGEPILDGKDIPSLIDREPVVGEKIEIGGREMEFTLVSMGNPHAVTFVDDLQFEIANIGPLVEAHGLFPNRINTEFIEIIDRDEVNMRVWERGAGETMACGTGACAAVVASCLNDLTKRVVSVHLLGGDLTVEWEEGSNRVFLTGPAEFVFEGEYCGKESGAERRPAPRCGT